MLLDTQVTTYEQACAYIRQVGILPLSSFIPDHPSLESITPPEAWHREPETDPWMWRDRFAAEGVAAYGRFFKKKPILISAELFPAVFAILGDPRTLDERYDDGELSQAAKRIFEAVEANGGIDSKALRVAAGLQSKESKTAYTNALQELQESCTLVIAGLADRLNAQGQKSGWNSTCYELAERWYADKKGHALPELHTSEAKAQLRAHLERVGNERSYAFFKKVFGL